MKFISSNLYSVLLCSASLIACEYRVKEDSPQAPKSVALSLDEIKEEPLALGSLDSNCQKIESFLAQFAAVYLPGAALEIIANSREEICTQTFSPRDNGVHYSLNFILSKAEEEKLFSVMIVQNIEKEIFNSASAQVSFQKDPSSWRGPVEVSDAPFASNVFHLEKTLAQWVQADQSEIRIFGRSYSEFVEAVLETYGEGNDSALPTNPELRLQLIPNPENKATGRIKMISISDEILATEADGPVPAGFMNCRDIECINNEVTYAIRGGSLQLISKPHIGSMGVMQTSFQTFRFSAWPGE